MLMLVILVILVILDKFNISPLAIELTEEVTVEDIDLNIDVAEVGVILLIISLVVLVENMRLMNDGLVFSLVLSVFLFVELWSLLLDKAELLDCIESDLGLFGIGVKY